MGSNPLRFFVGCLLMPETGVLESLHHRPFGIGAGASAGFIAGIRMGTMPYRLITGSAICTVSYMFMPYLFGITSAASAGTSFVFMWDRLGKTGPAVYFVPLVHMWDRDVITAAKDGCISYMPVVYVRGNCFASRFPSVYRRSHSHSQKGCRQ